MMNTVQAGQGDLAREREIAKVLLPLITKKVHSRNAMARAAEKLGISIASAYRKRNALAGTMLSSALTPKKRGPPLGRRNLRADIERIIAEVLEDFFFRPQKPTIQDVVTEIHDQCRLAGIERSLFPSRTAVTKRIRERGLYHLLKTREGKDAARKAKPQPGEFLADRPNQYWLIDHTSADIILVDRLRRLAMGRPTITLIIDAYTRVCVGFYVSLEHPSRAHTGMALLHAILPQKTWLRELGLNLEDPPEGAPEILHSDSGADFRSLAIRRGLALLVIEPQYRDPGETQQGGLIERFIGSMMGDVHLLPGTTFSNAKQRGAYNSSKTATMTLDAFNQWFARNVVLYNESPHRGLGGRTPMSMWRAALERGWRPRVIPEEQEAEIFLGFLPEETRTLRPDGIRFKNRRYWADWLCDLVRFGRKQIELRFDPRDNTRIWVRDAEQTWAPVLRVQEEVACSFEEQAIIDAAEAAQARSTVNEDLRFQMRQEQRAIVAEETSTTRKRRAQERAERGVAESRRVLGSPDTSPVPLPSAHQAFSTAAFDASEVEVW